MTHPNDPAAVARLLALLDLAADGPDRFTGGSEAGWPRVYGGQVVAQALVAASRTVDGKLTHSLHASFLRPGDPAVPIDFAVERERDGRSFATRRVVASQRGRAIFSMASSFMAPETGFEHHAPMPVVVAAPADLANDRALLERNAARIPEPWLTRWRARDRPYEYRPVEPSDPFVPLARPPLAHNWFRIAAPVAADPVLARVLLAYASDMTLLDTCLMPHGVAWTDPALQVASLDHALWFHAEADPRDWHLFVQDSPVAGGSRGLNRGTIHTEDGRLIASAVQEGLIRYRK